MPFMDHGLPAEVAGGTLSNAHCVWEFHKGGAVFRSESDFGHDVTIETPSRLVRLFIGDPDKATTSRRKVEKAIISCLSETFGEP